LIVLLKTPAGQPVFPSAKSNPRSDQTAKRQSNIYQSMTPNVARTRNQAGWGFFDLLCFIVACAMVLPLAKWVSIHYFSSHPRASFFTIMLIAYPTLGFTFCILMHRLFRWHYNRRRGDEVVPEDNVRKDA
jgi:hypothetical protein